MNGASLPHQSVTGRVDVVTLIGVTFVVDHFLALKQFISECCLLPLH
jgi:hypothetical protein